MALGGFGRDFQQSQVKMVVEAPLDEIRCLNDDLYNRLCAS